MRGTLIQCLVWGVLAGGCASPAATPTPAPSGTRAVVAASCLEECEAIRRRCLDAPSPPSPVAGSITGNVQPPTELDPQERAIHARCTRTHSRCTTGCEEDAAEEAAAAAAEAEPEGRR